MFATSARVVPHIIRACRSLPRGETVTWLPSTAASTASESSILSSPSLPFAVSVRAGDRDLHALRKLDRIFAYA